MPDKLHGLWYTPWLPVFFFLTAVAAGLGMTIVESHLSSRAFGHKLDPKLLEGAARVLVVLLGVYALWKVEDLFGRGNLGLAFRFTQESVMFWGEMGLGVFLPMLLFAIPAVRRNPRGLFLGAMLTVLGFIVNRLNVSLTGMGASNAHYFPSWMELAVTAAMVALGFAGFAFAVKNFAVFGHGEAKSEPAPVERRPAQPIMVNGRGLLALWGLLGVGLVLMFAARHSSAAGAATAMPSAQARVDKAPLPAPELKVPDTYTFPTGKDSPGPVGFDHGSHVGRLEGKPGLCLRCHQGQFSFRRQGQALVGPVTMERMKQGELCGSCHTGQTGAAFSVDDCGSCHQ
jgi:c(7)-type cytochrome triheme protein